MDAGAPGGAIAAGSSSGSGPAPFLLKTYEMVDDTSTDATVSWSGSRKSFVVWNPPEFARVLLPSYFKHNNFSSFIRQLNTYGFRKIDPERWEFANEDFVKDQKHLLKNIHRRKPIHSHSSQPQGSVDPERATFEEEIDKLTREKSDLEGKLLNHKEQQFAAKEQLENLTQHIRSMEQRQAKLLAYLEKAGQNPEFVDCLAKKLESMDFSAYNKKRRLPPLDNSQSVLDNLLVDNQSSSRSEFGNISQQEFCNKLRLELSPAVSDVNLISHSTQSSNEDGISPQARTEGLMPKDATRGKTGFLCPDAMELSDTGTSFNLKMDSGLSSQKLHSLQNSLISNDECDGNISCLLNLTLASSTLELNKTQKSSAIPLSSPEICTEPMHKADSGGHKDTTVINPDDAQSLSSSCGVYNNNKQQTATAPQRVNDVFWEQFLTERPGCSDTEEASSSLRANPSDEQEEMRKSSKGISRNTKSMEHLTL